MGTNKPQFSCYLDPQIQKEIDAHLTQSGQTKGKLIEQMWRFYNLREPSLLYDKLASRFTRDMTPQLREWAQRVVVLLQQVLRGET
jgi:hypothetical protein